MEKETALNFFVEEKVDIVLQKISTSKNGLSQKEAARRQAIYGKNTLIEEKEYNPLTEFLKNFKNPLILILLFAASISYFLGEITNGIIISVVIFASAILNFLQEYQANNASGKLKDRLSSKAVAIRDDVKIEIKTEQLTIGDVVELSAGDLIPADLRLIAVNDLFINESALTGESFPIRKTNHSISGKNITISEMGNMAFSGSSVVTGTGTGVVVKIGKATEIGKIAHLLNERLPETNFMRGIKSFSVLILRITILFVLGIFFISSVLRHYNLIDSFTFAIAIAVGLTPDLLPMIMSVTMSKGALRMAKRGVIVKRLQAMPNFGSMDVICTDKTGTLTEGMIKLVKYINWEGEHSERVFLHAYLNSIFQSGIKNPLDNAVISFKKVFIDAYTKVDEIPFDFVRRKMSIVMEHENDRFIITKGAPEEIFKSCKYFQKGKEHHPLTQEVVNDIKKLYEKLSGDGYRVVAVATKKVVKKSNSYSKKDESELTFEGFVAFFDPPRKDIAEILRKIKRLNVDIKVITGDNELVTKKICVEADLPIDGVLLGGEIFGMTDDALARKVEATTVFARFSPDQKNRVIQALKANGHVVGYVGDGINDAPSLKNSDVGISVENAVDVAKEAADMILTNKSLRVLHDGIVEGRVTFANTLKYIQMGISSNFGNILSVLFAVFYVPFLPMLPIQILLNNLLYEFSQLAIPNDGVDEELIRKPRSWDLSYIKKFMFVFGPVSSIYDIITFVLLFSVFHASVSLFQTGWFLESLATQTLVIFVIRTKKIPIIQSLPSKSLAFLCILVVIVGFILPFTFLGPIFSFTKVPFFILLSIIGIVILNLATAEIAKTFFFKRYEA